MGAKTSDAWQGLDTLEARILLSGDDHPDFADFPEATPLTADVFFGGYGGSDGEGNYTTYTVGIVAEIEELGDNDVFSFTTPETTHAGIVLGMQYILSEFAPAVSLLDGDGNTIAFEDGKKGVSFLAGDDVDGDELAPLPLEPETTYYVMMEGGTPHDQWETDPTGKYWLFVVLDITGQDYFNGGGGDDENNGGNGGDNGGGGGGEDDNGDNGGGGHVDNIDDAPYSIVKDPGVPAVLDDDFVDLVDYRDAPSIVVDNATGMGYVNGAIESNADTDAFLYTPESDGPVHIEIVTPKGVHLDAAATVYNSSMIPLWADSQGHAGATAKVSFIATAGETYVIGVSSMSSTGAYELRLSAAPQEYVLYHPEGYASRKIDEFIPLVNPNPASVDYTIIARYEWGERDQVLATGTLAPHSRGGITVTSSFDPDSALVRKGVPYALEIRSTGPLGAALSHYDYGVTTGESFTSQVATEWTFAQAHKGAGYQDFLVFSNPNDATIEVKATLYYEDGTTAVLTRTVDPLRRGGFAFASDPGVPMKGAFGVKLEADLPIVAALTSFDTGESRGFGLLGDATGGSIRGVIPALMPADADAPMIAIVNTGNQSAKVSLRASYLNAPLADELFTVTVAPHSSMTIDAAQLNVQADEVFGVSYASTMPVSVTGYEFRSGDADATAAATAGSRSSVIADAFVAPKGAGVTYFEWLNLHNPTDVDATVTLSLYFPDGSTSNVDVLVEPGDFRSVRIDQLEQILERDKASAFSIGINSDVPMISSFVHYDLFLDGGWSAQSAPLGMMSELALFN